MQKTCGAVLSLVICCSLASAQTLDELAEKEKKRREANAEAGKTAVVEADGSPPVEPEPDKKLVPYEPLAQEARPVTLDEAIEELEEQVPRMHEKWERERDRCRADSERFESSERSLSSCEKADELFTQYRAGFDKLSKLKRRRFWIRYRNGEIKPKN